MSNESHRKVYNSFLYLVICLFVYFETISRLLLRRRRIISISKECSLREGRGDNPTLASVSLEVAHKSVEIYILCYLSVNNSIIFSSSDFTLSPFSVRVVFLPQHGKILDEILDELLTRKI